jgi:tRNA G18 (ribose-2'-O)-methylase SpoU
VLAEAAQGAPTPVVLCLGAEREGLPAEVLGAADGVARIPLRPGGPESLNVAMAAAVALYELGNRILRHA